MTTIKGPSAPKAPPPISTRPTELHSPRPAPAVWLPAPRTAIRTETRGHAFLPVSQRQVDLARRSGDPKLIASALQGLAMDRSNAILHDDATRVERTQSLLQGMGVEQLAAVRAAYVKHNGCDPETNIRSADLGQPIARLDKAVALEMLAALNGPQLRLDAATLGGLLQKAERGQLTPQDRQTYFALMPRIGLWDAPARQAPDGRDLSSKERTLLTRAWGAQSTGLDAALKKIEAGMPPPDLSPKGPREKAIAVVLSSRGAQWQELMDWASVMHDQGYQLQLFTPDGRPAAFQRDSLCVSTRTAALGYGAPAHLDPAGRTGTIAKELLGDTASAASFDPKRFGGVYLAGGLGFNEDVAVARAAEGADGKPRTQLTANPNIEKLMNAAVAERLPLIAICHAPTLFAATQIEVDGKREPLNQGIATASLPPFEDYVGFTGRKEEQFTYDVNTHRSLEESGGQTNVLLDVAKMDRVVKAQKDGMEIVTGPGPQASRNLAEATIEALEAHWKTR